MGSDNLQFALFVDHHNKRYEELGFGTSTNELLRVARSIYQIRMRNLLLRMLETTRDALRRHEGLLDLYVRFDNLQEFPRQVRPRMSLESLELQ